MSNTITANPFAAPATPSKISRLNLPESAGLSNFNIPTVGSDQPQTDALRVRFHIFGLYVSLEDKCFYMGNDKGRLLEIH